MASCPAVGCRLTACKPGFFLPVRVLSRLFRRRFLEALEGAHRAGQLQFFGEFAALAAYSDVIRPLIPIAFGHRFRWDSATHSEAIRPPLGRGRYGVTQL